MNKYKKVLEFYSNEKLLKSFIAAYEQNPKAAIELHIRPAKVLLEELEIDAMINNYRQIASESDSSESKKTKSNERAANSPAKSGE